MSKLDLDPAVVAQARTLAEKAGRPIVAMAQQHTTVAVERATLRLAGLGGADQEGTPWVNRLLDVVRADLAAEGGLEHGVALPVWDALLRGEAEDLLTLAQKASAGSVRFRLPEGRDATRARTASRKQVGQGLRRIDARRRERDRLIRRFGDAPRTPWIYLIVATGDIYEDIPQAQQAAREGADVIAVIRSTGQSLLDYVPEGATREGFAGTYATQENFRLMRAALDESSKELGRYVRLTNYASGLCMPEIAALAGLERLDMMLNDSMYGILFRDINPVRTFVDQRFSRQVHARAGIIINTGEDNYLTTADAVEAFAWYTLAAKRYTDEHPAERAENRVALQKLDALFFFGNRLLLSLQALSKTLQGLALVLAKQALLDPQSGDVDKRFLQPVTAAIFALAGLAIAGQRLSLLATGLLLGLASALERFQTFLAQPRAGLFQSLGLLVGLAGFDIACQTIA